MYTTGTVPKCCKKNEDKDGKDVCPPTLKKIEVPSCMYNNTTEITNIKNVDECKHKCAIDNNCIGVSWNSKNKKCFTSKSQDMKEDKDGYESYTKGDVPKCCQPIYKNFKKECPNYYQNRVNLKELPNIDTVNSCINKCNNDNLCDRIVYNTTNKKCNLGLIVDKNTTTKIDDKLNNIYSFQYNLKDVVNTTRSWKREYPAYDNSSDIYESDTTKTHIVGSIKECTKKCTDTIGCNRFVYDIENKTCKLGNGKGTTKLGDDKFITFNYTKENTTTPIDLNKSDYRCSFKNSLILSNANLEKCSDICKKDSRCKGINIKEDDNTYCRLATQYGIKSSYDLEAAKKNKNYQDKTLTYFKGDVSSNNVCEISLKQITKPGCKFKNTIIPSRGGY